MNPPRLKLYLRQDCHLCEDMVQQLHELQLEYAFDWVTLDVDARPDWAEAMGDKVPLLIAGETEICRYFLDLQALTRCLGPAAPD